MGNVKIMTFEDVQSAIEEKAGAEVARKAEACRFCHPRSKRDCRYCLHDSEDSMSDRFSPRFTGVSMLMLIDNEIERLRNL